ncbi:hypothetical protein [Sphingomonas sp. VNH70]|uniref:hypothetical protein n=1 Tax=Sphingomonas silueang TaxID=3156617 RepID=UPI0032B3E101
MADDPIDPPSAPAGDATPATLARRTLLIGAAGASAVVSIRPALAQTQTSIMNCQIPVPDPPNAGRNITPGGKVVDRGTGNSVPGARRPFTAEEVRDASKSGNNLPGADREQTRAYLNYIRRLQPGTSGYTCFASLQMPRG